jgi:hypothetical protein
MPKNVATFDGTSIGELLTKLGTLGYEAICPDSGRAHGFTSKGEGPISLSSAEVPAFFAEGNGVVLWRGSLDSVYISLIKGKLRLNLDGLSALEQQQLFSSMQLVGLIFSIAHEDSAYET